MLSPAASRTSHILRIGFIGTIVLATLTILTSARSERPQSLADYISAICATPFQSPSPAEAPYLSETIGAMAKMMIDMGIQPTGDVDRDFVEMMVPHHQGAIDMAIAVLRHGRNARIRRLAQEIIATQQQEIAVMRLAVGEPLPPSTPSPTQIQSVQRPTSYADAETISSAEQ